MATTEILQFAGDGGANVLSQAAYAALTSILADGYPAGILASNLLNKTLRQSNFMSVGLASFCVAQGISVPDDGNISALVAKITAAIIKLTQNPVNVSVGNINGSGAYVAALTPLTITVPTGGATIFVDAFASQQFSTTTPKITKLRVLVDSSPYTPVVDALNGTNPIGVPFLTTRAYVALAAGSHSVGLEWYGDDATAIMDNAFISVLNATP